MTIDEDNDASRRMMSKGNADTRLLEEFDFKSELLKKTHKHLQLTGKNMLNLNSLSSLKSEKISKSANGDIIAVFSGSAELFAEEIPTDSKQTQWILDSFNTVVQKAFYKNVINKSNDKTLAGVSDIKASLGDGTNVGESNGETVTLTSNNNSGLISGMLIGIFVISSVAGYIYSRGRRNKSRGAFSEISNEDYGNNTDQIMSTWHNDSVANSLGDIAAYSAHNDSKEGVSQSWNSRRKTPMSKLAAGATQEEFAENGMIIDVYGQTHQKKKKKKGSPTMSAKKGAELDTTLDPIEEVNSSVASSMMSSNTDDKIIKGNLEVPKLLPALSVSSCPSDENAMREYNLSPSKKPALASLTPEPDELMTPSSDEVLSPSTLQNCTRAMSYADDQSPVRKLIFSSKEFPKYDEESDKSSDSGVKELLACDEPEKHAVISEEEAVKANLIAFIDDCENEDEIMYARNNMLKTLGADDYDKENYAPGSNANVAKSNSTILVLAPSQNK